jgi:hypothetical protein
MTARRACLAISFASGLCLFAASPLVTIAATSTAPAATPAPAAKPAAPAARAPAAPARSAASTAQAAPPAIEPRALQALQRMSSFLSTLNSFEAESHTSLDLVTMDGQTIQLDGVANYKVLRPNSFVIDVSSDLKKRRFIYDGKNFTVYSPELGYYATVAAPPTIRQTLDTISERFGITLPLEDLFRWNDPNNPRRESLTSGFWVGTATIDGVETDQYAFRGPQADWQVWIQKGDQPLPRKLVIIDRTDPARPAYSARLTWTLNPTLTPADFTFQPGKDAKQIQLSAAAQ